MTDTTTQTTGRGESPQKSGWQFLKGHLREYGILIALVVIMAFFQVATGGILLKPVNLTNLVLQNSYIVIMAIGMLLVIVAGHIDLSVGSVLGFIGALAAVMIVNMDVPYLLAIVICLVAGGLIGAAQGYWVAYWKIPSFIVTLAGMLVFRGLSLLLLEGQSVGPFPREFQALANGFVTDIFPAGIGQALAQQGIGAVVCDMSEDILKTNLAKTVANLQRLVERQKITEGEAKAVESRIGTTTRMEEIADVDLVIEADLKPWDVAAGLLFVTEAGGMATTIDGTGNVHDGQQILVANSDLHPQIAAILRAT